MLFSVRTRRPLGCVVLCAADRIFRFHIVCLWLVKWFVSTKNPFFILLYYSQSII